MLVQCDGSLAQQYHCKGQLIHCLRCTGKSWSVQGDLHHEWWLLLMQPLHLNGQGFPTDEREIMTWHKNYDKIIYAHFLYPQIHILKLERRDPPPCSHFSLTVHTGYLLQNPLSSPKPYFINLHFTVLSQHPLVGTLPLCTSFWMTLYWLYSYRPCMFCKALQRTNSQLIKERKDFFLLSLVVTINSFLQSADFRETVWACRHHRKSLQGQSNFMDPGPLFE